MSPWIPRERSGDRLLCKGCKQAEEHRQTTASAGETMPIRTVAHDSGDGATIYHCPFCGSGQVIARSDRSVECEYCHTCFTVQVQPQFPAFPQTINGAPVQVPGMPGMPGGLPAQPPAVGEDPMADPMADPAMQGAPGEEGAGGDPEDPEAQEGPPQQDEESDAPPWAKGASLRTTAGARLDWDNYLRHLAIRHADDKDAAIERVRAERRDR
jgi:hypothetical protein